MADHHAAALVRAIRRAHYGLRGADERVWGHVIQFTVRDIHAFADALLAEGVTVKATPKRKKAA